MAHFYDIGLFTYVKTGSSLTYVFLTLMKLQCSQLYNDFVFMSVVLWSQILFSRPPSLLILTYTALLLHT